MSLTIRTKLRDVLRYNLSTFVCLCGMIIMIILSMITSLNPAESLSGLVSVILEWYVPLLGVLDFVLKERLFVSIMPKALVSSLAANNPAFYQMITQVLIRNGQYRANSLYGVSLSLAEFEATIAPFGFMFIAHGRHLKYRLFGVVITGACMAGIFVSGSRGGYLSFLVAAVTFAILFTIRNRIFSPRSLAAPIFGVLGILGFFIVGCVIEFVGKVHKAVFGSGEGAMSDQARELQWELAWPSIRSNPITGHGYALGGDIVGYSSCPGCQPSVDSYLLSLIVETGIPSALFYFGIALTTALIGGRRYLKDQSWAGVLAGGIACSITAHTQYRLFLSQRENQTLFFILVACAMMLHYYFVRSSEPRQRPAMVSNRMPLKAPAAPTERKRVAVS